MSGWNGGRALRIHSQPCRDAAGLTLTVGRRVPVEPKMKAAGPEIVRPAELVQSEVVFF